MEMSASTSPSRDTSADSKYAGNPCKRPRVDAAASGGCTAQNSKLVTDDFSQLDLYTETNDRSIVRDHLLALEELNLVSRDPKVTAVRRKVVFWLAKMTTKLHLSSATMHIALNYLDRVWATATIAQERVLEVTAACLLSAAKFEEIHHKTPYISEIVQADITGTLTAVGVSRAEMLVLQHLDWRMRVATCQASGFHKWPTLH